MYGYEQQTDAPFRKKFFGITLNPTSNPFLRCSFALVTAHWSQPTVYSQCHVGAIKKLPRPEILNRLSNRGEFYGGIYPATRKESAV